MHLTPAAVDTKPHPDELSPGCRPHTLSGMSRAKGRAERRAELDGFDGFGPSRHRMTAEMTYGEFPEVVWQPRDFAALSFRSCGVPKLGSHPWITTICRRNRDLARPPIENRVEGSVPRPTASRSCASRTTAGVSLSWR